MSQLVTTKFRRLRKRRVSDYLGAYWWIVDPHDAICFLPGDRPDPLEESAASITWREMTEHMRERDADI